jgi:phage protein D
LSARIYAAMPVVATDNDRVLLQPEWADRLVEVRVDTTDAAPAFAALRFRDPAHQLLTGTGITIGTPLTISAVTVATRWQVRVFTGEVTGLASEYDDDGTFTVLRAHDKAHRLTQGRRLAVWQGTTLGQVVSDLAGQAALKVGPVTASAAKYPRLVQPNITDWQFLRSLAELHGAVVTVEDGVLSLVPPTPAALARDPGQGGQDPYTLTYGENLLALDVAVDSTGPVGAIQVRGWNSDAKESLVEQATVAASDQVEIGTTAGDLAKAFTGDGITELVATGYALEYHLAAATQSFAGAAAAAFADLEATVTGTPELKAGSAVSLAAVGWPFTGQYTVTGARHLFDPDDGYRTQISVSSRQRSGGPAAAGPATAAIPGLAIGIVADVREPDGVQSGGVKVTFPWLDDKYTSDWARTVQFGGVDGGGVISPSQGDEVLVGFEQGRLDRPYVLGGLYNGKDKPSDDKVPLTTDAGKVNRRSLSSRGGDRIDLLDTDQEPGVLLTTGDGNVQIRLDRASGTLSLTAKKIIFDASDSIVIKTPDEITLEAKNSIVIKAPKVDVK